MSFLNPLQEFLNDGGWVLYGILIAAFFLWSFIIERFAYYFFAHRPLKASLRDEWISRSDKTSWRALAVRDELVSRVKVRTDQNVGIIKTLVAMAPLLGLLGTVTGMINVFDAVSYTHLTLPTTPYV